MKFIFYFFILFQSGFLRMFFFFFEHVNIFFIPSNINKLLSLLLSLLFRWQPIKGLEHCIRTILEQFKIIYEHIDVNLGGFGTNLVV